MGEFLKPQQELCQFWSVGPPRARVRIKLADIGTDLARGRRTVDEWRSEGLEALEMISVHMGEEASQRWWTIIALPKVVDLMVMMMLISALMFHSVPWGCHTYPGCPGTLESTWSAGECLRVVRERPRRGLLTCKNPIKG
jgi:hypothetical protein